MNGLSVVDLFWGVLVAVPAGWAAAGMASLMLRLQVTEANFLFEHRQHYLYPVVAP